MQLWNENQTNLFRKPPTNGLIISAARMKSCWHYSLSQTFYIIGYSLFNVWEAKTKYLLNLHSSEGHRAYSHVNGTLSQPKLTISMISKEHKYFLTTRKIVKCQISSNKYRSCNNWSLTVSSEIECANILFMCNIFVLIFPLGPSRSRAIS